LTEFRHGLKSCLTLVSPKETFSATCEADFFSSFTAGIEGLLHPVMGYILFLQGLKPEAFERLRHG
jgi:hypothetical protein